MTARSLCFGVVLAMLACNRTGPLSEAELGHVRGAVEGYVQAVLDRDWDRATGHFTEDAVRLPMNAPAERGARAIREHFAAVDSVTHWTLPVMEVEGIGDLAYARFFFTLTAYFGGRTEPFTYTGKQLLVLRRQPNGHWLIVTDMWNGDAAPGT